MHHLRRGWLVYYYVICQPLLLTTDSSNGAVESAVGSGTVAVVLSMYALVARSST